MTRKYGKNCMSQENIISGHKRTEDQPEKALIMSEHHLN